MTEQRSAYCWDATLLIHAERADRLDVLGSLLPPCRHVVPDIVHRELLGMTLPVWIGTMTLGDDLRELRAFSRWLTVTGATEDRHRGEAAVLAWSEVHRAVPIIDDAGARRVAGRHGFPAHGSLWALTEGIAAGRATVGVVSAFCDEMLRHDIRWPFGLGGFASCAHKAGLLSRHDSGQDPLPGV